MSFGFRLTITETFSADAEYRHYSGYSDRWISPICVCPGCRTEMFPAIHLDFADPRLRSLGIWSAPSLTLHFCVVCSFFTKPYYVHVETATVVAGGNIDKWELLNSDVETPYECRVIQIDSPPELQSRSAFENSLREMIGRRLGNGVYHQFGGLPINARNTSFQCCQCHGNMIFGGILDSDDLTVPLFERDHQPLALLIGDMNSMNYFLCDGCGIVCLAWAR